MKSFWIILALGCVGLGAWLLFDNHRATQEAQARARMEEHERLERERKEARERMELERRERAEMLAKEDAIRLLQRYITAQESLLKQENDELQIRLEMLDIDSKSLSDELISIDKAVERRSAAARQAGRPFREKLEQVEAMLESKVIARLAETYLNEDFSAERLRFKASVQQWIRLEEETAAKLAKNRKKYNKVMGEIDADMDTKLAIARTRLDSSSAAIGRRAELYKEERDRSKARREELRTKAKRFEELDRMRNRRDRLSAKKMMSPWERKELEELEKRVAFEEERLERQKEIYALAQANMAHLEVTAAEVQARRRGDKATAEKAEDDDAVHEAEMREKTYFNLANTCEIGTLDRLRIALVDFKSQAAAQIAANNRKLKMLSKTLPNMDFLTADQIKEMKTEIAEKMAEGVTLDLTGERQ